MDILPDPELSDEQKKAWERARKKIGFEKRPPLKVALNTGDSLGSRRYIVTETKVKPPVEKDKKP